MSTDVSIKNTKNEIIAAYEELLKKANEKKTEEPKKVSERQKQETLVKNAGDLSYDGIVKEISNLKVGLSSTLDKLGENFVSKLKKFKELQQAIQIEKKGTGRPLPTISQYRFAFGDVAGTERKKGRSQQEKTGTR